MVLKIKEILQKLESLISSSIINVEQVKKLHINFITKELKAQHCVDKYIGDFPTFIEPVHLGDNVELGDDVLIGPNVYIGNNCKIGDFSELINTIVFDNVTLGNNFKLENCIVAKDSKLTFNNIKFFSYILKGQTDLKEKFTSISF
jgi:NDP-sugar pyrophosphorylase family protein